MHRCISLCLWRQQLAIISERSLTRLVAGELQSKLEDSDVTVIITLSRQSIASLAVAYHLTPMQVASRLAFCLRELGAKAIFDANTGRELALREAAAEFLRKYRTQHFGVQGK